MENDVEAVFLAEPIADFIATTTTVILFIITIKKLLKGMREKKNRKKLNIKSIVVDFYNRHYSFKNI